EQPEVKRHARRVGDWDALRSEAGLLQRNAVVARQQIAADGAARGRARAPRFAAGILEFQRDVGQRDVPFVANVSNKHDLQMVIVNGEPVGIIHGTPPFVVEQTSGLGNKISLLPGLPYGMSSPRSRWNRWANGWPTVSRPPVRNCTT